MDINELTAKILQSIPTYDNNQMEPEQFDNLTHNRFNISNYQQSNYNYQNYYVFRIEDPNSSTGYRGMCINKEFYKKVKEASEKWKSSR